MNDNSLTTPPSSISRPARRWWLRGLLILAIFLSGVVVGGVGALLGVRQGALRSIHHPEELPGLIASRLRKPLSLSGAQTRQVEEVLRTRIAGLTKIRDRFRPEVDVELDGIHQDIGRVLDEQQRTRWDRLFNHIRQTWVPD